jgi:predicted alpha/beta-hydrolase family hydrolase
MMRLGAGLLALTLLLALSGCGGKDEALSQASSEGPIGKGASGVWLYRPAGKPKDVVVYFHGQGGPKEATPVNHLPWIKHLVDRGSVVVYPRYEMAYEADPMPFIVNGVRAATKKVDVAGLPVLAIGYSRGGAIAVEYGAVASEKGLPVPDWIMSVFPAPFGNQGKVIDLASLRHFTELLILVGDQDSIVGTQGAALLGERLQAGDFPGQNIQVNQVLSHGSFTADHFAPMQTSPAARDAFWRPADQILDGLDRETEG